MRRGDLSDGQWDMIKGLIPRRRRGGRWNDHRTVFNGILWILRTGAPWRDLPEYHGKWGRIYHRFTRWRRDGSYDRVLHALRLRLDTAGHINWDLWYVDGSSVRGSRAEAGTANKAMNSRETEAITRWVAAEVGGGPNSTWSLTARAFPSPRSSRRAKRTSRDRSPWCWRRSARRGASAGR